MLHRDISIVLDEHSKRLADYESNRSSQPQVDDEEWGISDEAIVSNGQWLSLVDAVCKKFFPKDPVGGGAETSHGNTYEEKDTHAEKSPDLPFSREVDGGVEYVHAANDQREDAQGDKGTELPLCKVIISKVL